uniref:Uncharacterized protein AlNc14C8G1082 n=1 Tax=Albugo laibachii Nc14 TaxID=890382 RepID=F0W204_9STRA|nr:conserved hypothetical protein [Albugo laibachii Nc14]|eukprot:CCA15083.1 conserved hypothetical protein [Albugo laibachii Nc14]
MFGWSEKISFTEPPSHERESPPAHLLFTPQLHHQLQCLSKTREWSVFSPRGSTNHSYNQTKILASGFDKNHIELNGWELEKKVVALTEMKALLQEPYFYYLDWRTQNSKEENKSDRPIREIGGSKVANSRNLSVVTSQRMEQEKPSSLWKQYYRSFPFQKTLPLGIGQTCLLDLWEYLLDMCEVLPIRNRSRNIFLQLASCVCRRAEFIHGYQLHEQSVSISVDLKGVLLCRGVRIAASQLNQSLTTPPDCLRYIGEMYAAIYLRFPSTSSRVLAAVNEGLHKMKLNPGNAKSFHKGKNNSSSSEIRSEPTSHWHEIKSVRIDADIQAFDLNECKQLVLGQFFAFKKSEEMLGINEKHCKARGSSGLIYENVDVTLKVAFEQEMAQSDDRECTAFLSSIPLLYSSSKNQALLMERDIITFDDLDKMLGPFLNRIQQPARENMLIVPFTAALFRDIRHWRQGFSRSIQARESKSKPQKIMIWHCIPGYLVLVRAIFTLFRQICRRRAHGSLNPIALTLKPVGLLSSRKEHEESLPEDYWAAYWHNRDLAPILDEFTEIFQNNWLVNPFVQVALEGTNILDSASVNYSITILQKLLMIAASTCTRSGRRQLWSSHHDFIRGIVPRFVLNVSVTFDSDYFIQAVQKALGSLHVEILLKIMTFLYTTIALIPPNGRQRLFGETLLRKNFFNFFLHWNEEVRKIFCHLVVYRMALSNRLALPCSSDRVLLVHTPYFEGSDSSPTTSPVTMYWTQFTDFAQTIFRSSDESYGSETQEFSGARAVQNLINWDSTARLRGEHSSANNAVFRESLSDEELSVDLSLASKLDVVFKMLADQLKDDAGPPYFERRLEIYAEKAMAQYVFLLKGYYEAAFDRPQSVPTPPSLEFNITYCAFRGG